MKMILDLFAGGHSVTLFADAGASAFTASASSDVQKNAEVTLTVTLVSGYEVDEYEVIAGGIEVDPDTKKFTMGEENVVIYLKTKANNVYMVTEECSGSLNGAPFVLHANTIVTLTPNGVPCKIEAKDGGQEVTVNAAIQQLIDQGILIKQ